MSTLTMASEQWSNRPDDQKFSSLADLHTAVSVHRDGAAEAVQAYNDLRVKADETGSPVLIGASGNEAHFTNWSFGQLANRIGAPAQYLRKLPGTLAAENINYGLEHYKADGDGQERESKLLLHKSEADGLTVRAFTSDRYCRIWNRDITSRLIRLTEQSPEWQPAPAAFDGSRGLYASDQDMFVFMVDNERRIFETDKNGGLGRGFFAWNSEVGAASFGVMTFLYEYVCGNHRVWGASNVQELRIRHVGNADDRAFRELTCELRKYADSSAADDELKIERARRFELGTDKESVLDKIFGLRVPGLSRKLIDSAYDLAEKRIDWYGSPRTAWGMGGALTEIARDLPHADERVAIDRAAGKVMQLAF